MRIRQIKPEFWKDARVAGLTEGARLFYVGTWQLADDKGWLRWSVEEIAAELYPFDSRKIRERRVDKHGAALAAIGRLHLHDCGHAQIPKMPAHQHLAGTTRRVETIAKEHAVCAQPATPRDSPRLPAPVSIGSVGEGSVRKGSHLRQNDDGSWEESA
jgi:hypothetical protein